jgi:hypothetical protein
MAFDNTGVLNSFNVTVALANQYVFVTLDSNGQAVLPAAGGDAIGVTQDTTTIAGDPTAVCRHGAITKVLCNGTFAAGAEVMTDATGSAVLAATGGLALGKAITAGAAGFLATIVFQPQGRATP